MSQNIISANAPFKTVAENSLLVISFKNMLNIFLFSILFLFHFIYFIVMVYFLTFYFSAIEEVISSPPQKH